MPARAGAAVPGRGGRRREGVCVSCVYRLHRSCADYRVATYEGRLLESPRQRKPTTTYLPSCAPQTLPTYYLRRSD